MKLVLMSATMNAERFAAYFGGCPTVSIPGRAQPVKEFRLEDALQVTGHLVSQGSDCAKKKSQSNGEEMPTKTYLKRLYPSYNQNVIDSLAVVDESITNYGLIADLLHHICTTMEEGAVLIFLSGLKGVFFPCCFSSLLEINTNFELCHRNYNGDGCFDECSLFSRFVTRYNLSTSFVTFEYGADINIPAASERKKKSRIVDQYS